MNEQDKKFEAENDSTTPAEGQNVEYSLSGQEIPHRSYMDANFIPKSEEQAAPRTYSYYTPPVQPPKKEKKSGKDGIGKLIAACLVCAILGGIGGGAIVASQLPETSAPVDYSGSRLNIANPEDGVQTPNPVAFGETMTGSEIYSLGCTQAVGITTEITYTNYLGMKSSSAVSGSGFIVTEDGYIVTNYHVISEAYTGGNKITVMLYNGDKFEAKIVGVEEASDIAVLKINATGLSAATLGDSDSLQVGEMVYAIGNPLGELSFSLADGRVSALDREITTQDPTTNQTTTNNMFQISAAVNEGNSGGPVYNDRGEVIGVVTAKYADTGVEGLGFALPINDVSDIIDQLIANGYVSGKANFGITVTTVNSAVAQYYNMVEGAYVYSVAEGSCSDKAGLKVGDIITAIDGKEIASSSELTNAKKDYKAGDTVSLKIFRQGAYLELSVTLDENIPTDGAVEDNPEPGNEFAPGQNGNGSTGNLPSIPKF